MRLSIVDRQGDEHVLTASAEGSLMEVLRDLDYGVAAICGGVCSCATCHVYVAPEWHDRLPTAHSDERDLLAELQHRQPTSRLACQIRLAEEFDGVHVTVAPEE